MLAVQTLREELSKQPGAQSKGGRRPPLVGAGVRAIEAAVSVLECIFTSEALQPQWTALTSKQKSALIDRLAQCGERLATLQKIGHESVASK